MSELAFPKHKRIVDPKALRFYRQHQQACEGCRTRRGVEAHHIKSRARGGDDVAENLLCLCHACHAEWTGVNRTRREWLEARRTKMTDQAIAKVERVLG